MTLTKRRVQIETALRYVGCSGMKKGFWGMCYCVELALEDPTALHDVTKRIYPQAAKACGLNKPAMVRDLRSLVEWCWYNGDREALRLVAGRRLKEKPSVGEFIDYLCGYLRRSAFL